MNEKLIEDLMHYIELGRFSEILSSLAEKCAPGSAHAGLRRVIDEKSALEAAASVFRDIERLNSLRAVAT